jgi:hypothetical protein
MAVKRVLFIVAVIIILGLILVWFVPWITHGGLPLAGPTGDHLPPHILFVEPADGNAVVDSHGFCMHFNYVVGHGVEDEQRMANRYYLDGRNVSRLVVDLSTTEYGYPDPVGEPCLYRDEPLKPGWHTAKVRYTDTKGDQFSYTWRFFVLENK